MSIRSHSPSRPHFNNDSYFPNHLEEGNHAQHEPPDLFRPDVILETSEPASPDTTLPLRKSLPTSTLADLIRNSPPAEERNISEDESEDFSDHGGVKAVTVGQGIISQPNERTVLLLKRTISGHKRPSDYASIPDLESQKAPRKTLVDRIKSAISHTRDDGSMIINRVSNPKLWNKRAILTHGVYQPISYVPPVILGLLLNILDALSYGKIGVENDYLPELNLSRHDTISSRSTYFRKPWARRYFYVLCQLYCVPVGILPWR